MAETPIVTFLTDSESLARGIPMHEAAEERQRAVYRAVGEFITHFGDANGHGFSGGDFLVTFSDDQQVAFSCELASASVTSQNLEGQS